MSDQGLISDIKAVFTVDKYKAEIFKSYLFIYKTL